MPLGAQTPPPAASAEVAPAFAMPADFAPAPYALPSSRASQQKRLAGLLRGFEPVQSAEVLLTGEAAQELSAQVLIKPRAGRELSPEVLESLIRVLTEGCPGLQPARLTVVESNGKLLYAQGQMQTPDLPARRQTPIPWLLAALVVGVVAAVAARQPWKRHTAEPAGPFDFLKGAGANSLERLLADERPEVVAVLARQLHGPLRRRVEAWLQRQPTMAPQHELEGEVREALAAALRRKYHKL
ncbi:MAG: hypothetical protein ABFD96_19070 [Armatimonadia bacterium]